MGTTGMPLNAHYCGDVLASLTIAINEVDDTNCCGDKEDCCSDQEVKIDVDKDYLPSGAKQILGHADMAILPIVHRVKFSFGKHIIYAKSFNDYSPPEKLYAVSYQVRHCTFLI